MSNLELKLMVRVFTKRMADGESFEDICKDYPKMTSADIKQLKKALGIK